MRICCQQSTTTPQRAVAGGFTLIEVLVASLVGTIIFAALFSGISEGLFFVKEQRDDMRANEIIEQQIESIRLCQWGFANGTNSTPTQLFATNYVPRTFTAYESINGSNATVYTGTITIVTNSASQFNFGSSILSGTNLTATLMPSYYTNQFALVTVTVSWQEYHGKQTNFYAKTNQTFVAQNGIQNYIYNH
jgi:prepilin-type N-terminal cleavage/methylation domain-containing protein